MTGVYFSDIKKHSKMKSFQLILLCFVCVVKSFGQAKYGHIVIEITKEKHKVSANVIESVVPRRDSSWVQLLDNKLNQSGPIKKAAKKGKNTVSVIFIVDRDGNFADVECEKDRESDMCKAVVSIIKKMPLH
jgi:hypothetical protein